MIDYSNASTSEKLKAMSDEARRAYGVIAHGQNEDGSYTEPAGTDAKWTLVNLADLLIDVACECEELEKKFLTNDTKYAII